MYSIFHFWTHLAKNRKLFPRTEKLDKFKFDVGMLSCNNEGVFPDLAIKLNKDHSVFTGGELIELKDSKSYMVSSFNSTIPTGTKNIQKIIPSENSTTFLQMRDAGDNVYSLEEREVYYLVRGKKGKYQKICLVHGSFFETIGVDELIRQSFAKVLEEKFSSSDISNEDKERLEAIFSEQEIFSRVRHVSKASVKLRFRILTEVKPEGNILNSKQYPEIEDDTLNFVIPFHSATERDEILQKMEMAMSVKNFKIFDLKHPLNGWFVVFQITL